MYQLHTIFLEALMTIPSLPRRIALSGNPDRNKTIGALNFCLYSLPSSWYMYTTRGETRTANSPQATHKDEERGDV